MTVRIAHITTVSISLTSLLLNQLRSISQAGYEVITISTAGPEVAELTAAGIRHIAIPISRNITPGADLISLARLYQVLRREKIAVVHTHTPKPGLLGQLAARMAGVPVVINTLHGFYFHDHMRPRQRRFYIELEKIAARCSDVILSQNQEDIQTAIREGICPSEKIKHLGNGIDLTRFIPDQMPLTVLEKKRTELRIPQGVPIVGFVGRLAAKRKGFADFMLAAKEIIGRVPNVRFLIVGDPDYGKPDSVQPSIAKDYGIEDRCLFVGERPNEELPILYALMHVFVLPSLFEGIPRVIMEASAMGVPSVATNVKGNREAVIDGQTGFLVPLGDVPALVSTITQLLTNDSLRANMGRAARRLADEQFDEQAVFTKVKAEYRWLLASKGLPVPDQLPLKTTP